MFELAKMQALQLRYVARLLSGFKEAIDCLEGVICAICSGQIPDHRCGITEFKRGDEPGEESLLDIKFYRVDNGQLRLFFAHELHYLQRICSVNLAPRQIWQGCL